MTTSTPEHDSDESESEELRYRARVQLFSHLLGGVQSGTLTPGEFERLGWYAKRITKLSGNIWKREFSELYLACEFFEPRAGDEPGRGPSSTESDLIEAAANLKRALDTWLREHEEAWFDGYMRKCRDSRT